MEGLVREVNMGVEKIEKTHPNPRQSLITTLLHDLQVSNLDPRDGEVRDLELDRDGYTNGCFVCGEEARESRRESVRVGQSRGEGGVKRTSLDRRQSEVSSHQVVLSSSERLDLPDERSLLGSVVHSSDGGLSKRRRDDDDGQLREGGEKKERAHPELWRIRIVWHRHQDLDVVGRTTSLELSSDLDDVLHSRSSMVLHGGCEQRAKKAGVSSGSRRVSSRSKNSRRTRWKGGEIGRTFHPDQRLDGYRQSIAHQLELSIRRNERDRPIVLESSESNTLMELDVLHFDGLST